MPLEIFLFQILVFIFFGAVSGSLSSAIIYRLENGQSWIRTQNNKAARSKCPKCQHFLAVKDLIPILSWVLSKGKCRYCARKISSQYLALEIISIIGAVIIYAVFGFTLLGFAILALQPFLISQAVLFQRRNIISKQLCGIIGCGLILCIGFIFT